MLTRVFWFLDALAFVALVAVVAWLALVLLPQLISKLEILVR